MAGLIPTLGIEATRLFKAIFSLFLLEFVTIASLDSELS
jgi:hypothetical protein